MLLRTINHLCPPQNHHHSTLQHSNSNSLHISHFYNRVELIQLKNSTRSQRGMATLQKFKFFATQCGVQQSPTLSPRTSPLIQMPRPKTTLRTLLGLTLNRPPRRQGHVSVLELEKKEKDSMRRHSLKDLFVSSPPREEDAQTQTQTRATSPMLGNMGIFRSDSWKVGPGLNNPVWTGFRCRSLLKRKAWRPMLLTISEQ